MYNFFINQKRTSTEDEGIIQVVTKQSNSNSAVKEEKKEEANDEKNQTSKRKKIQECLNQLQPLVEPKEKKEATNTSTKSA